MSALPPLAPVESNDPVATPRRVALVRPDTRPSVRRTDERYVMTFPHLILREAILFQVVVIVLAIAALAFDAPLEQIANPVETPNPAKAPWYFLGLQELVHYSALVGGVVVPTLLVALLLVLPYVDRDPRGSGRWFAPERRVANAVFSAVVLLFVALTAVGTFFRGPNWAWVWPW